jgi:quercetin dioxygenase-like cupin family protein
MTGSTQEKTMSISRSRCAIGVLLALLVSAVAPVALAQDATPSASTPGTTTREILNEGLPEMSPGYELVLTRVVIPPGAVVGAHMHPGMQLIYIESGTIHYTLVSGELPFTRRGADGTDGESGTLVAGEETDFGPGDRFVEMKDMVHIAENLGDVPVVILASSLLAPNLPASIPIDVDLPATPNP